MFLNLDRTAERFFEGNENEMDGEIGDGVNQSGWRLAASVLLSFILARPDCTTHVELQQAIAGYAGTEPQAVDHPVILPLNLVEVAGADMELCKMLWNGPANLGDAELCCRLIKLLSILKFCNKIRVDLPLQFWCT